jgi:hypothetical protein
MAGTHATNHQYPAYITIDTVYRDRISLFIGKTFPRPHIFKAHELREVARLFDALANALEPQ